MLSLGLQVTILPEGLVIVMLRSGNEGYFLRFIAYFSSFLQAFKKEVLAWLVTQILYS
jgi:hypothetical protein